MAEYSTKPALAFKENYIKGWYPDAKRRQVYEVIYPRFRDVKEIPIYREVLREKAGPKPTPWDEAAQYLLNQIEFELDLGLE